MSKDKAIVPDMVLSKTGEALTVSHSATVTPSQGAAMYPGGPTTAYFASCECGFRGPVRGDSYQATGDVEAHLTDPKLAAGK